MIKYYNNYLNYIVFILTIALTACGSPPQNTTETKRVTLKQGDILFASLNDTGLHPTESAEIIKNLKKVFKPRRCRPGDYFEVKIDSSNKWIGFNYYTQNLKYYEVEKDNNKIIVSEKERLCKKVVSTAKGQIKTSLWEAMREQDLSPLLINSFTELFAWQIDFLTEPRQGDTFKVIWEKHVTDDGFVSNERITAAQYINSGQFNTSILYTDSKNKDGYFAPDGSSLRRAFLRAPLQYSRISSFFSNRRFHPILRYYRPHLGIDYAAPRGTPVSAVADGRVIYRGWKGGNGRFIKIRHTNGYVTYYGHLWRYHKSMHVGNRVKQGEVIGYVGSSGLSTGPHLDFRISKNGKFINFLRMKIPPTRRLAKSEMKRFKKVVKKALSDLANIYSNGYNNLINTVKK